MKEEIIVFVSCPEKESESIARPLIEENLAACVSIIPAIKSMYLWKEKFCSEQECLLFIKSNRTCWPALEKRIKELHSYEIPEIIATSIELGHQPYLNWLNQMAARICVKESPGRRGSAL